MENLNQITISPSQLDVEIAQARKQVSESLRGSYGAKRNYAELLNQKFEFDWFELKANDSSDEGKQVRKEKEAFQAVLKEDDHSNPYKIWADVRMYAQEARYPKQEANKDSEVTEAEQGESGANHNRSPMLRNIEELTTLYKFNRRQESLDPKIAECQQFIGQALQALGIQLHMIED
jgi:hypothetical protein